MAEPSEASWRAAAPPGLARAARVEARGGRPPYELRRGPTSTMMIAAVVLLFALAFVALLVRVY